MLREHTVIHICPMLNPDGVLHGNGRCDALGKDLNRTWDNPDARKQPAIAALKRFLVKLRDDPHHQVDLYIDLHAHSGVMGGFVFANLPSSSRPLCGAVARVPVFFFPRVLAASGRKFGLNAIQFDETTGKAGCSRRALADLLPATHCYTVEVSYHCPLVAGAKGPPFTELSCTCLGESPLGFRSPHACISGRQRELTAHLAPPALLAGW
ncbi:putative cytosolic carboxypeptidase 6 [Paratrimastix pyriformis]|uniref:Cytosolic carboxypeptidase 6 n=1 Tax=Paratrimastix pyriformis TaxID=342808 RepID=A0ABQ8UL38_9EUKA|nr:putative cytosolic carboxypeptidase 6 [Paratrimastix pyriformis]